MKIKDMQILVSVRKLKGANLDFLGVGKIKARKQRGANFRYQFILTHDKRSYYIP